MPVSLRPLLLLWMFSAALLALHPFAGAVPLLVSIWRYPGAYKEAMQRVQSADSVGRYGLALGLLVFAAGWLMHPPAPQDDLLRNIPSYAYGFSHTAMFPHTSLPSFNLYPGFDHVLGVLAQRWGESITLQLALVTLWLLAIALVVALARRNGGKLDAGTAVLLCLLLSSMFSFRLLLGRPEMFCTVWGGAALLCRGPKALAAWCVAGLALSSSYSLFPVYLVFGLLLPTTWTRRIVCVSVLLAFHLAFWSWHAGSLLAFVQSVAAIPAWSAARLMGVSETKSIWPFMLTVPMLPLALLAFAGGQKLPRTEGLLLALVGGYFFLPDMVRYGGTIALLFFIAALPLAPAISALVKQHAGAAVFVLLLPAITAHQVLKDTTSLGALPHFQLPAKSVVLTSFDPATFAMPFFNPGRVQVVPAMEVGATDKPYQAAAAALSRGKLSCDQLEPLDITHVVERSQKTVLPCLKLTGLQGDWRMWEVVRGR
jgi:hypothetical protein